MKPLWWSVMLCGAVSLECGDDDGGGGGDGGGYDDGGGGAV